jgi:fatty acid desaturase
MSKCFINRKIITKQISEFVKISKQPQEVRRFIMTLLAIYAALFAILSFACWLSFNSNINNFFCCLPLLILFIGCLQYILAQAAHEAIHFYIDYGSRKWTSMISSILVLYSIGVTKNFKKDHTSHHLYFGDSEKDAEQVTFMSPPRSKLNFWFWIVESFIGLSTAKRIVHVVFSVKKLKKKKQYHKELNFEPGKLVLTQGIIFLSFIASGMWWAYFVLWILPLAIVAKTLINIRLLAEHSPLDSQQPALRSFLKKDWSTRLLGVYGFKYHAEHHLFPGVSYNYLENISEIILEHTTQSPSASGDIKIEFYHMSYLQFLRKWYSTLPLYSFSKGICDV